MNDTKFTPAAECVWSVWIVWIMVCPLRVQLFRWGMKCIHISIISQYWDGAGSWHTFSVKTWTYLFHIFNIAEAECHNRAPFSQHGLNWIPAQINNYMPNKMWNEIIYRSPNVNGCTVVVLGWITSFISYFNGCNYVSRLLLKLIFVSERPLEQGHQWIWHWASSSNLISVVTPPFFTVLPRAIEERNCPTGIQCGVWWAPLGSPQWEATDINSALTPNLRNDNIRNTATKYMANDFIDPR